MNCRERFLTALHFKEPDIVPVFASLTPQIAEKLGRKMGLPFASEDSMLSTRNSHTEILLRLGNDAVCVAACRDERYPTRKLADDNYIDEWGIIYKEVGLYTEAVSRPLANVRSLADLDKYPLPDPLAKGRWELAEKMIAKYQNDYAIIGDLEASIFEIAWNLVGLEKFLMDLALEELYVAELLDRIMEYSIVCGQKMIDLGADLIWTGDDFGTQKGMMIAPEMWRAVFKPRLHKLFDALKKHNPQVKIAYHSCGSIVPIIEDLIEIGLDFLNPIQPAAVGMDLALFKQKYGDRLGFFGGVDVQGALPRGTVADVKEEVKKRIKAAATGGGFIIAPAHNIQPDTPLENIEAFFSAIKEYGKYPINL
jgi:uroporphyrinogen decarboxylase